MRAEPREFIRFKEGRNVHINVEDGGRTMIIDVDVDDVKEGIYAETRAREAALTAEATARTAADTALRTDLTAEANALANAVSAEATARSDADAALQAALDAEESVREDADTALGAALSDEVAAREGADASFQQAVDAKISKSEGLLVDTYMPPAGFWTNISGEGKARYATLEQSALAMFGAAIQGVGEKPVLFGYDPATGGIIGFPVSSIEGATGGAVRGGNPLIALIDYPDGYLLGGNPLMAAEDYYPNGHLYGGDPFMY